MQILVLVALIFSGISVFKFVKTIPVIKKRFQVALLVILFLEVFTGVLFMLSIGSPFEEMSGFFVACNIFGLLLILFVLLFSRAWKCVVIFSPSLLWILGIIAFFGYAIIFPHEFLTNLIF